MLVSPVNSGLAGSKDRFLGSQNSAVNDLLPLVEFPVGRKGHSDIGAVAVILCAHIAKHESVLLDQFIINHIVQSGGVLLACANAIIGLKSCPCSDQVMVLHQGFTLEFLVPRPDLSENLLMALRGKLTDEFHYSDFLLGLSHSGFVKNRVGVVQINWVLLKEGKCWKSRLKLAVRVHAGIEENGFRLLIR